MWLLGMRNLRSFEDGRHALPGDSGRSVNLFKAVSVLVLLTISGAFGWTAASALSIPRGSLDRASIPGKFGVWDSINLVIDNKTKELLSQGDLLSRAYIDMSENGRLVHVFITAAKESKAFHDPLMCLPAAGNVCLQDRLVKLQLGGGEAPVEARLLRVSQDDGTYLVIYWYTAGGMSWSDTSKVQIYMKRMALMDAVHILMNPFGMRKIRQKISDGQFVFHRFAMKESGDKGDMAYLEQFIGDFASHTGSIAK
jgi:hypothetical protein